MTRHPQSSAPKSRPALLPLAAVSGVLGLAFCIAVFILPSEPGRVLNGGLDAQTAVSLGWVLGAGLLGAVAAVVLLRDGFGRDGRRGWVWALVTGIGASALGGLFAGTLVMPGYGSILGAMTVFFAVLEHPTLLMAWLAGLAVLHLTARRWRVPRR
ncbi:MAG: hypothetical protein ABNH26_11705 [Celeribacter sp.]